MGWWDGVDGVGVGVWGDYDGGTSRWVILAMKIMTTVMMTMMLVTIMMMLAMMTVMLVMKIMMAVVSAKPVSCHLCIIYCACVWAPHQRNHLDRLEKVQQKNTRTRFFKQFTNADVRPPYSNRLIDLDIVWVEDALKIQRLILGFKILNDLAPASFGSYIQHSRLVNTRLLHQVPRTSSFFNSMFISLPHLWDEILVI